jgi:hypothetical protein
MQLNPDLLGIVQNKLFDIIAHMDKAINVKAMNDFIDAHPSLDDALEEAVAQGDTEAIVIIATMIRVIEDEKKNEAEPLDMSEIHIVCDA